MKNNRNFMCVLLCVMFVGSMTGCGAEVDGQDVDTAQAAASLQQAEEEDFPELIAYAEENGDVKVKGSAEDDERAKGDENVCGEQFEIYEPFGLIYDVNKNELYYNGKVVRWFEDYYPLGDGSQAGRDFFNEKGVVDVYAVRDFSDLAWADDGSFDPSGKLTGIEEFSEEEFTARDVETIKNPVPIIAVSGEPVSVAEFQKMAEEYETFGVTYDAAEEQWYFNGEKVRYFRDILLSNGESPESGKFQGAMRTFENENGTVDIYTVRDYENLNASGYGTLVGIDSRNGFE